MSRIGICSDHTGLVHKEALKSFLARKGHEVTDLGAHSPESMDYPDVAHKLARSIENGEVELGIAICGTGNGMALTLNHHDAIRAGLAWNREIAALVKRHNNANVLVMPARFTAPEEMVGMCEAWLSEPFEGGRHLRRIEKILSDR